MAENTYKRNTVNKPKEEAPKEEVKSGGGIKIPKLSFAFLNDRRFILACGFFLIIFSFYTSIALVSYLFTGTADQSVVEKWFSSTLPEAGFEIRNWLGVAGAVISHLLIFKWFGVASFLFLPILFIWGFKIVFEKELFSIQTAIYLAVFFALWLCTTFGYLALITKSENSIGFLGGGIGYELASYSNNVLGWGTFLVLVFSLIVFTIYFFNITSIAWDKKKLIEAMPEVVNEEDELSENAALAAMLIDQTEDEDELTEEELEESLEGIALITQEPEEVLEPLPALVDDLTSDDSTPDDWMIGKQAKLAKPVHAPLDFQFDIPEDEVEPETILEIEEPVLAKEPWPASEDGELPVMENYDPTLDLGTYQYPTLDLLNEHPNSKIQVTKEELEANKDKIVETLSNYNIGISQVKATVGPTVTLYEIVPDAGVRIAKIKNLEDDIALSLAALGIRIIAPIPGKGTIGIEVPNKNKEMVPARSVFMNEKFIKSDMELPLMFGKTISNEVFMADLAKMPHLLIAGATGMGKSVGLNMILTSLLYKKHPSQLKFVLVDPKKVELSIFSKIERHFLAKLPGTDEPIITDTKKVVYTLNSVCIEMDNRYDLLKLGICRNIKEYNQKFVERRLNPNNGHKFLPYIVVVIDELADLMMTAGKEVETPIARIAQLARAVGIHLVVATQRPSVNVITGIIKANFPARLSFKVSQKIDSRTILDTGGADQLIGKGDMLLKLDSEMIRLQCAFLDTPEVERIVDFIGDQRGYPTAYMLPEFSGDDESGQASGEYSKEDLDPLFVEAARLIVSHQQGSTSLIQRRMSLGYNRAGRIIDQLESIGIVGVFEGSKAREVIIKDETSLDQLLRDRGII
jgi:S-DNA-T family DNA segregation ATPase FtsK/SpoIIIE